MTSPPPRPRARAAPGPRWRRRRCRGAAGPRRRGTRDAASRSMPTVSFQTARPAMKPDAPPSSQETCSTWVNSSKATPAESTAHGAEIESARRRQAAGLPGYSSLSRSGLQLVEGDRRRDDRVGPSLRVELLPRQRVDQVLDHRRHAGGAAVLDHLADHLDGLGGEVGAVAAGPVGAHLDQELQRVAALAAHPRRVQRGVAGAAWLLGVLLPDGRLGGDQDAEARPSLRRPPAGGPGCRRSGRGGRRWRSVRGPGPRRP